MEKYTDYLNRTLAPILNRLINEDYDEVVPSEVRRSRHVYREVFHPHKGEGRNTYMIRHVRMKDEQGDMWAALYRKCGKKWNEIDSCEAKTRKVIDRKIQTWKKRYDV